MNKRFIYSFLVVGCITVLSIFTLYALWPTNEKKARKLASNYLMINPGNIDSCIIDTAYTPFEHPQFFKINEQVLKALQNLNTQIKLYDMFVSELESKKTVENGNVYYPSVEMRLVERYAKQQEEANRKVENYVNSAKKFQIKHKQKKMCGWKIRIVKRNDDKSHFLYADSTFTKIQYSYESGSDEEESLDFLINYLTK